jgi:hypothetical protein
MSGTHPQYWTVTGPLPVALELVEPEEELQPATVAPAQAIAANAASALREARVRFMKGNAPLRLAGDCVRCWNSLLVGLYGYGRDRIANVALRVSGLGWRR